MKRVVYLLFFLSALAIGQLPPGINTAIEEQAGFVYVNPNLPNIVLDTLFAFPGAEGWGRETMKNVNYNVYHVTSLAGDGAGTLRWGIKNAPRPCLVVFDVSGYIDLTDENGSTTAAFADRLTINSGDNDLYIAGQTAPNKGITLKDASLWLQEVNNVIIQHIRIRPGSSYRPFFTYNQTNSPQEDDDAFVFKAFSSGSGGNVIVDHVTISWGEDGNLDLGGNSNWSWSNISITNCMIYENWSTQYTSLLGGYNVDGLSLIKNYFANDKDRKPAFGFRNGGRIEFKNNLTYGGGTQARAMSEQTRLDMIGNVDLLNPSDPYTYSQSMRIDDGLGLNPITREIYFQDNIFGGNAGVLSSGTAPYEVNNQIWTSTYTPMPAIEVQAYVLANAGASIYRDAADTRVVNDAIHGTGGRITNESQVGGFPALPTNTRSSNDYEPGTDIPSAFYNQHNLSGGNNGTKLNWDFGTFTVTNNAGYSNLLIWVTYGHL